MESKIYMKYKSLAGAIVMSMGVLAAPVALADLNDGLVAYYPFNGNAEDASGNGNNGTVNGATLTEDRLGNADSAYSFDGNNDYIEVEDDHSLDLTNTFTISLWIKQTSVRRLGYRLVDKVTAGVGDGYGLDTFDGKGGQGIRLIGAQKNIAAMSTHSLNEWHYVAVTFLNGISNFYLEGIPDGSGNHGSTSVQVNDLTLKIGAAHFSNGENFRSPTTTYSLPQAAAAISFYKMSGIII